MHRFREDTNIQPTAASARDLRSRIYRKGDPSGTRVSLEPHQLPVCPPENLQTIPALSPASRTPHTGLPPSFPLSHLPWLPRGHKGVSLGFHCTVWLRIQQGLPAPRTPSEPYPSEASHSDTKAEPLGPVASPPRQSSALAPDQREALLPHPLPTAPHHGPIRSHRSPDHPPPHLPMPWNGEAPGCEGRLSLSGYTVLGIFGGPNACQPCTHPPWEASWEWASPATPPSCTAASLEPRQLSMGATTVWVRSQGAHLEPRRRTPGEAQADLLFCLKKKHKSIFFRSQLRGYFFGRGSVCGRVVADPVYSEDGERRRRGTGPSTSLGWIRRATGIWF